MRNRTAWWLVLAANVVFCCVLSFYQTTDAAAPKVREPFANSVEQRMEMIAHLREIRDLLREQNELLRSGSLQVVIALPEKQYWHTQERKRAHLGSQLLAGFPCQTEPVAVNSGVRPSEHTSTVGPRRPSRSGNQQLFPRCLRPGSTRLLQWSRSRP